MLGITVRYGEKYQPVMCLVDSGADDIVLTMEVAKELGLDPSRYAPREIGTFAGPVHAFDERITIEVERFEKNPIVDIIPTPRLK